jgi:RNA polymerase sigma-70 factor (ECF subfamily)
MVDIDTRHTLLGRARRGSRKAVAELCELYRGPVEAYVRKLGHREAEDLTQGFFAHVIEVDFFSTAERERGKFRHYVGGAVKRFIARERRDAGRQKRGGEAAFEPIEEEALRSDVTPEDLFQQRWREVILHRASKQLLAEYERRRDPEAAKRGRALVPFARERPEPGEYERLRVELAYDTVNAVKLAVKRMRERYEVLVQTELAKTIDTQMAFDDEYEELELGWSES